MTVRADIRSNRLIYSCNCGWIDLGHADSLSRRPHVGAQSLWNEINQPREKTQFAVISETTAVESDLCKASPGLPPSAPEFAGYRVTYKQDMATRVLGVRVSAASGETYVVRHGLTPAQRKSVALAIFMEVSLGFEKMQGSWPYSWTRAAASSFSEEDLVSNLIGFYRVVEPSVDYLKLCRPVSRDASEEVWDTSGGVSRKNRQFMPLFHRCKTCLKQPEFPRQLQTISAAKKGELFYDFDLPPPGQPG
jgi:hypothetical protein